MRTAKFLLAAVPTVLAAGAMAADPPRTVVVTNPVVADTVASESYVCKIFSQRHIGVRALSSGYLEAVPVREGQAVKKGEVLFRQVPALHQAKMDAEAAEVRLARLKLDHTKRLFAQNVVSKQDVELSEAEHAKAQARAKLAEVEMSFATVRAPFDGLVGRLEAQEGSLVKEGDALTTLSDNSVMWCYFNVSEARYLEYRARHRKSGDLSRLGLGDTRIELVLADGSTFGPDAGNVVTVEASFNGETGTVAFRADVPNPDRLLRHGQTGAVVLRRTVKDVTVIPQRAAFEALGRRYVYVVGKDGVARRREITVEHEADETFVIQKGLGVTDTIVLEEVHRVLEGDEVVCEFRKPEDAIGRPKIGRGK